MHLVVCLKQIIDPEIPPSHFRIDPEKREVMKGSANWVMSTFDECALEMALTVKDQAEGVSITALSLGPDRCEEMLKKALALKCDRAVRIVSPDAAYWDAPWVALALARAVATLPPVDLVLCGREAGDWDGAQVGPMLAEYLQWPLLTDVTEVVPNQPGFTMMRHQNGFREVWDVMAPAVMTAINAKENVLRLAKVRDIMLAARQSIHRLTPEELSLPDGAFAAIHATSMVESLEIPQSASSCYMAQGETLRDQVGDVVRKLKEFGVI